MPSKKGLSRPDARMETITSDIFRCDHLGKCEGDEEAILSFRSSRGPGLERYLRFFAFTDESSGEMRTYLVRDIETGELVGYFSVKAGLVSMNEGEDGFDTAPGIELANFAVNDQYIDNHPEAKGIGLTIFRKFVIPIIEKVSSIVGAKICYIFALPKDDLIKRYKKYGFSRLAKPLEEELHQRLKPRYDERCIFMYLNI